MIFLLQGDDFQKKKFYRNLNREREKEKKSKEQKEHQLMYRARSFVSQKNQAKGCDSFRFR